MNSATRYLQSNYTQYIFVRQTIFDDDYLL